MIQSGMDWRSWTEKPRTEELQSSGPGKDKGLAGEMNEREPSSKSVDVRRHGQKCMICLHPECKAIERDFLSWRSPVEIAKAYGLADRSTVYRHAHALNLLAKRRRNVRAALERIIEKAGDVEVTAASVVAAVQAYAKINAAGHWIDRTETVNLHEVFDRMTAAELETYARDGTLPDWFPQTATATPPDGEESLSD
jgi:hypothetical protein